ncbi:hypothetical protein ES705_25748 [subsurface metagenome]
MNYPTRQEIEEAYKKDRKEAREAYRATRSANWKAYKQAMANARELDALAEQEAKRRPLPALGLPSVPELSKDN